MWQQPGRLHGLSSSQNGGYHGITTDAVFPQGEWVHVAAIVDDQGNGAIYWNGQAGRRRADGRCHPRSMVRANQYRGPKQLDGRTPRFTGAMDEVKIWSEGRTADQIRQDMTATPSGSEPGLEAYYGFDEGQGSDCP